MSLSELLNSAAIVAAVGLCFRQEARLSALETLVKLLASKAKLGA